MPRSNFAATTKSSWGPRHDDSRWALRCPTSARRIPGFDSLLIRRDENVLAREFLKQRCWLVEIRRQNIQRITCNPRREINRLVNACVKSDQHPTGLVTNIFDRMPVTLRDVADVPRMKLLDAEATMRTEHRHGQIAIDDVLPLIRVGMPVQLPQRARFKIENHAGDRSRNRKSRRIDAPFATAFEHAVRRVGKHPKLVRLWRREARSLEILRYLIRWYGAAREINLLLRKAIKR